MIAGDRPTIAAGFARALFDLAVSRGADRQRLAELSGLDPDDLADQDRRVPLAAYKALMRAGQTLARDPALALHFGEAFGIDELSIVGLIGHAAPSMGDALTQLNRYGRLAADLGERAAGDGLVLSRRGGHLWLIDTRTSPADFPEFVESGFARMVCAARRAGQVGLVEAVHFTHAAPAYRDAYERVFQVPVVFEADHNALRMADDAWLALTGRHPSPYVHDVLSERAEGLLQALEATTTLRDRVERLLAPALPAGGAAMDDVAAALGLSRQTLHRRLKAEGATFAQVLDRLRHRLALDHLDAKISVSETAHRLGFSDPAAFSRAFKRWTGLSPRAHRPARSPPEPPAPA